MPKTDSTWLRYCYFAFAVVAAFVMSLAIDTVGSQTLWAETVEYFQLYSTVISVVFGFLAAYLLQNSEERREYHLSVIGEVRKVRWPTAEATKQMTRIVAIVVAIFAVILFAFDSLWLWILKLITS